MAKRNMNPNSLKNLENRVPLNTETATKAQQKGAVIKRKRGLIRKAVLGLFDVGPIKVEDIAQTIINEALQGKEWAVKLIYDMDENYQNRKLKSTQKDDNAKKDLIAHLQNIKIMNPVEMGLDEPYESLNRTID